MKTNKTTKEKGYFKRLREESLILSCLGGLSSKLLYFLKVSIFSFFLCGSSKTDAFIETSGANKGLKYIGFKKHVSMPIKTLFTQAVETSPVVAWYRTIIRKAIYMPVSTYGAFFVTFGIYIGLVYCVKLYAFVDSTVSLYNLLNGCLIIIMAFPLLFSNQPLIKFLEKSAFVRSALSPCIPFEVYSEKRGNAAVGTAIIFGSIFGVLTFFFNELSVLTFIAAIVAFMLILYSPEIGVFTAALVFPFASGLHLTMLIGYTFACYLFKVLRGKRNLQINAGNIFVLILMLNYLFVGLKGGGKNAFFAFAMAAMYLLASNLLATEKLIKKCVQTLCLGLSGAVLVYLFQILQAAYADVPLTDALFGSTSVFENVDTLIKYSVFLLPYSLCKSERSSSLSKFLSYAFGIIITFYSILTDSAFYAILTVIVITVYFAVKRRQIFRPLFACAGIPLLGLYFSGISINIGTVGFYNIVTGWLSAIKISGAHPFLGVGTSEESLALAGLSDSSSMYLQTLTECGALGFALLCLAIVFAVQRIYTKLPTVNTEGRNVAAATGAATIAGLVFASFGNLWYTTPLCAIFWLSMGVASAACHVRINDKGDMEDEY